MTSPEVSSDRKPFHEKIRGGLKQTPNYLRALHLIWSAAHSLFLVWLGLLVLQGLLPAASVYLTKLLVDRLVAAVSAGFSFEAARALLLPACLMAALLLATEVLQSLLDWVRTAQSELIQDYITDLIQKKSVSVDLAFYESPEYFDHLQRAQADSSKRSLALLDGTGILLQNTVALIGVMAILLPYSFWLTLLLIVAALPAVITALRYNYYYHQWWNKTTTDRRWAQYYHMILTNSPTAAEVRLFDLGGHFRTVYQLIRQRLRSENLKLVKNQSLTRLFAGLFSLVIFGLIVIWIGWWTLQDAFTLGDLALFYQAYSRGQNLLTSLMGGLSQIYANSLFLSDLFVFLELQPTIIDPPYTAGAPSLKEGIHLRGVTYHYPGSERPVLKDFNLFFPAGKITAIVGENGAGKSTLTKLLCRFYDPQEGVIEMDGVDIRSFPVGQLRQMISVMFQLPVTYYATAGKNIAIGDLNLEEDRAAIERAARESGAHEIIADLPKEYETLLGKLFAGGEELSVGEWQRLALARAFLRKTPLIILDEPTSFMDSWAEADWLNRFHELVSGRTGIMITHRFTTARHADLIYVMKKGKIVEQGTHIELIAREGLYAQSWQAQVNHVPIQKIRS